MIDAPLDELQFVNMGPVFERPADALKYMDEQERAAIAELEAEARARMDEDQGDPTKHQFFMRTDTRTVVKDEKEYVRCQLGKVELKVIPYRFALQLLKEEDAHKKQKLKAKRKKKTAKQSRKKNR